MPDWTCEITPAIEGEARRFIHDLTAAITIPELADTTLGAVSTVTINGQVFRRALPPDFRPRDFEVPDEIAALFPDQKDEGT